MSANKFHAASTAFEVIEGHDLTGYNVIVTGANSGLGYETVRALAKAGASCYVTVRNVDKSQSGIDSIKESTGNTNIYLDELELDSLESVNAYVARFLSLNLPLHILINNAGVMACPLTYTRDGHEMQFGTNHLGHFALTMGLIPCLKQAVKETGRNSRVVNLSSTAHANSDFNFEDYNFKTRDYDEWESYGQSKTANVLFSIGLTERYAQHGIYSNAVMPGVIITNLGRHLNTSPEEMEKMFANIKMKTIEEGSSTTVWAAVAKELDGKGGLYLENCSIAAENNDIIDLMKFMVGYLPHAMNPESVKKLWELSEQLIKKN